MKLEDIVRYLAEYDGPEMNIMEVCGSHTAAISKNGIPDMLSEKLHLVSGPGCPVCVTPSSYVDRLIELSMKPDHCVVTFGDLLRVPGSVRSLSQAKGDGARVIMVYSPMDVLKLAEKEPQTTFVFAAVGFETTTPVYALLMQQLVEGDVRNVKLLTALKTMPEVIGHLCSAGAPVQGFLAPGHVSVITGAAVFRPVAERYGIPFGVAGFTGPEILMALYAIVRLRGRGEVKNLYPSVVTEEGNTEAKRLVERFFEPADAAWRGMGEVAGSGRILRQEYRAFDAGSSDLTEDRKINQACRCDQVLMGKKKPTDCPLFGKVCTPLTPQGACMVSTEGSCFTWLSSNRKRS
jgi:hydrogenase expression/formation protein HypD|uniref:Hydrogenase expression/formation protein HypD n=1 Tax=Eubacterium cellulosolvens (strain ATCC 43171 / JCM 9499 / 6) TaxID=633697 RepID=I5ASK1_EUBC6